MINNKSEKGRDDEDWWVDYIENELSLNAQVKAEMLLRYSEMDRLIVNNLKSVKTLLKEKEYFPLLEDEKYLAGLQARIMNQVSQTSILKSNEEKEPLSSVLKLVWKVLPNLRIHRR